MKYLVTTDPHRAPQEVEAPVSRAAAVEVLDATPGDHGSEVVCVRRPGALQWDVVSCVWNGTDWWPSYLDSVPVVDTAEEVESLRAQLREEREIHARMRDLHDAERVQWQASLRAERARVRDACVAACRTVEAQWGDPFSEVSTGRAEGADECAEVIGALDLDALPENAPSR